MQIAREGKVVFNDASFYVWEEGISNARTTGGLKGVDDWECKFKCEVFARIVQQLNRLGWKLEVPADMIKRYNLRFARSYRYCRKGDLQGQLEISGRCIKFEMWQDVANVKNPSGGKYDFDKEDRMPYVMRLEMERTRRRIRTYLCNVFSGYAFGSARTDSRSAKCGPNGITALEYVAGCYESSHHFKGDWPKYLELHSSKSLGGCFNSNRKSADGELLAHGQRVWAFDHKGRPLTGIAHYNINNMWWVVTGKYGVQNLACHELYTSQPENMRLKRNARIRRRRLEQELSKATASMNFERAAVLRDILFRNDAPLFMLYNEESSVYHKACFQGYTKDTVHAGKFTYDEVKGWANDVNKIVPLVAA